MSRPTTHDARVRWALALGADPKAKRRRAALFRKDVASRWLAVVACHRSRDGALLLRAIRDPSRRVRGKALVVLAVVADDAQAAEALRIAHSMRVTRILLRQLGRRGRTAPIDDYLDWLAESNHVRELIDELPRGSASAVQRHLSTALARPSAAFWKRLARHHPAILGGILLERWRAGEGEADPVTRQLTDWYLQRIAELAPDHALELCLLLFARGIHPPGDAQDELARRRPRQLVELAYAGPEKRWLGSISLSARALARLDTRHLILLAVESPYALDNWPSVLRGRPRADANAIALAWARAPKGKRYARFFPDFAPFLSVDIRAQAWPGWSRAVRDQRGVIAPAQVAGLPRELREAEARRHLQEVVALRPRPGLRLSGYARHLPWDELQTASAALLGHPDGDHRALALTELLASPGVRDEPERVPDCLALVRARKFEQDPIRGAMLGQLAAWPLHFWKPAYLEDVAAIIRDALDAADLSDQTASKAEALILRLFAVDAPFAARWIGTLIKERGRIYDPGLGRHLDRAAVELAAPALLTIARAWAARDRSHWLLGLCESLGGFLTAVDGLTDILLATREKTPYAWLPIAITRLLAIHAPDVHAATYPDFVARCRKRPDWLLSLARNQAIPWIEEMSSALGKLLQSRRRAEDIIAGLNILYQRDRPRFAASLPKLLQADPSLIVHRVVWRYVHRHRTDLLDPYLTGAPVRGRFATGKTAWLLPMRDGFHRWTAKQNQRFAQMLLGVAHDPERDTPAVMWALGLLPRLLYAPMDGLCALADDDRPAVRERAIRVLARCDAGQGVATLMTCLGDQRARFAIYGLRRALLSMPPEQAADALVEAPLRKVTIAKEVVRLLGEIRCERAYEQLSALAHRDLHRDVRIALLRALWDHLDREPTWAIYQAAVSSPDWVLASRVGEVPADRLTEESDRRLSALLAQVIARPEPEARLALLQASPRLPVRDPERSLLGAIRARLDSVYDDEVRAAMTALCARQTESDADALQATLSDLRHDLRALRVACEQLLSAPVKQRASLSAAARAAEAALAHEPRAIDLYIHLGASHRDATSLVGFLCSLEGRGALGHSALDAMRSVVQTARAADDPWARTHIETLLHAGPGCRRAALWVLERCVAEHGWTRELRAILGQARADADIDVANAAWRLFPPREDDVPQAGD